MYINVNTQQYPVSLREIRQAHPNKSIPDGAGTEAVADLDYAKVNQSAAPVVGPYQRTIELAPTAVNGIWMQHWSVVASDIMNPVNDIDCHADEARMKIVVDPVRAIEYERAADEAQAFKSAGYDGTVPQAVKSWAEAKAWTAQQAADNILAEASAWNAALYAIRDIRLKAKEQVRASNDPATWAAVVDAARSQISALLAQLGK